MPLAEQGSGVLPPEIEAMVPGGSIALGAAKDMYDASKQAYQNQIAKGLPVWSAVASATPLIGPIATKIFSPNSEQERYQGIGEALPMLAPFAAKGVGTVAKVTGASDIISKIIGDSAVKSYGRALGPTTEATAGMAENAAKNALIPDKTFAVSNSSLVEKVAKNVQDAGVEVGKAVAKNAAAPVDVTSIADKIRDLKEQNNLFDKDTGKPHDADSALAMQKIDALASAVENLGPSATVKNLYSLRKDWDTFIRMRAKGKEFQDAGEAVGLHYKYDASNIVRDALNQFPEIKAANEKFGPWADAQTVLDAAESKGLLKKMTPGGSGLVWGGSLTGAAYYAGRYLQHLSTGQSSTLAGATLGLLALNKIRQTTGWQTLSAGAKASVLAGDLGPLMAIPELASAIPKAPPAPPPALVLSQFKDDPTRLATASDQGPDVVKMLRRSVVQNADRNGTLQDQADAQRAWEDAGRSFADTKLLGSGSASLPANLATVHPESLNTIYGKDQADNWRTIASAIKGAKSPDVAQNLDALNGAFQQGMPPAPGGLLAWAASNKIRTRLLTSALAAGMQEGSPAAEKLVKSYTDYRRDMALVEARRVQRITAPPPPPAPPTTEPAPPPEPPLSFSFLPPPRAPLTTPPPAPPF